MKRINRRGAASRIASWAVALGLAAGSTGCMGNSVEAKSAATETAKVDRHFVREGRELREVRVPEPTTDETAKSDRHFVREGRELREPPVPATPETAKPVGAQGAESQSRGALAISSTFEAYEGR